METDRVVPVVIFLRQAKGVAQRLRLSGDQDTYLDFRYLSCALGELSYENHRHSDNLVVRLNLPNVQYPARCKNERAEYQRDYPDEAQTMSRFAERFHEQGMQQGVQQGMQQGVHQGEALVLERQLRLKFGTLPDDVRRRIEQASEQTLLEWSERILTASRLDEVLQLRASILPKNSARYSSPAS